MSAYDETFNAPSQAPTLEDLFAQIPQAPPPMPAGPVLAPSVTKNPMQQLLQVGSIIAAALGGPRSGLAGLPTGVLYGQHLAQQEADRQAQFQAQQQQRADAQKLAQQRIDEQRQAVRGRALGTIAQTVPTFDNPEDYNRFIENAGNTFLLNGYNQLGPNQLRQAYPFVAPTAEKKAKKVLDAWFKNPANAEALKKDPSLASRAVVQFDANGDGVPENIPLTKLGDIAGVPFAMGPDGKPVTMGRDMTGDKFHVQLNAEIAKFKATNGREPNDQEFAALAQNAGKDPELAGLQKQSLELTNTLKKMQESQQPTRDDAIPLAQDLVAHKMAPSQLSLLGGFGASGQAFKRMVLLEAKKLDPTFNFEDAEGTFQLAKSPAFQQTIRYMDYVGTSTDRVIQNAEKLANGNVRSINALINAGKNQINDVDLKAFQTSVLEVSDAIAKILQGGGTGSGTSDAKLKQAQSILSTSDSPAAIRSAVNEIKYLIANRRSSLVKGTYLEQATPPETPSVLDAAKAKLGIK